MKRMSISGIFTLAVLFVSGLYLGPQPTTAKPATDNYLLYVGTYTGPKSKGIYSLRFHAADGSLEKIGVAGELTNPSFLALHPNQKFLYAVTELGNDGKPTASVSSFRIDPKTGALTPLNSVMTGGGGACHLVVDKTQRMLVVANYGTGSVSTFHVNKDGTISEKSQLVQFEGSSVNPKRQKGPHAHAVVLSSDNRFVFVPDLGTDQVMSYRIDPAAATLTPNNPPSVKIRPGSGPRHFAFHPNNKVAYTINEMGSSVTAFAYDGKKGALQEIQTISTLPEGFSGVNNSAEIQIDRAGRFLYASNRGHNSITVFSIDPNKYTLTKVQTVPTEGKTPRNFSIDPTGRFLLAANQDSDSIVLFRIDEKTGELQPTGKTVDIPSPVDLVFVPAA